MIEFLIRHIIAEPVTRINKLIAFITRIVHIHIILRRIPRLVRIPRIDPQKKPILHIIPLQPVHRLGKHARTQIIGFKQPPALIRQIAHHPGFYFILIGRPFDLLQCIANPRLTPLPTNPGNRTKSTIQKIALRHKHRRIKNQPRCVSCTSKTLCHRGQILLHFIPRIKRMPPTSRKQIASARQGWKRPRKSL